MNQIPEFPEEEFDVVICGTGLKECILSGLLSKFGKKKVLHLDRNKYYGGECASLNLTNLWAKFRNGADYPKSFGDNRDWNVDLIPKFIIAGGTLVEILLKTGVSAYLEWLSVEGTYVYQYQKAGLFTSEKIIHKVPATKMEALKSNLLSMTEKLRIQSFMEFAILFDEKNSKTWKSFTPTKTTMKEVYTSFGLQQSSIDYIGHAVALHPNDNYIMQPMLETMKKMNLYFCSFTLYGNSPFIYPIYGLQGLPEGFSRLCAVNHGVFMLNKPIDSMVYDENNKVCGVKATTGEIVKCKQVVCDPSYVMDSTKIRLVGKTIRVICILNDPIPDTNNAKSCQIIIPQRELKRHSDIYIMMVSSQHQVCKQGKYVAIVSASVETNDPEREIQPALQLLGKIEEKFVYITDMWEPTDDGKQDNVFVSSSYDAESHFESATNSCLQMWEQIMGSKLDLSQYSAPQY